MTFPQKRPDAPPIGEDVPLSSEEEIEKAEAEEIEKLSRLPPPVIYAMNVAFTRRIAEALEDIAAALEAKNAGSD